LKLFNFLLQAVNIGANVWGVFKALLNECVLLLM